MTEAELIVTNQRLNRRCQQAESEIAYYKARYQGLQNAYDDVIKRTESLYRDFHTLYSEMYHQKWKHRCFWCKLRWGL